MSEIKTFVTRPSLPPLEDFIPYLNQIWDSRLLTNAGPLHQELETKLADFLKVDDITLFNNGTSALISAIQALELKGEVITTPFSFAATSHSIIWNHLTPVFVDTEANGPNIDPENVMQAISDKTSAVLGVHCYGHPCQHDQLKQICESNNLKLIYDAAHCFGSDWKQQSLAQLGDISIISFHATKVFNTFEGGAVVTHSDELKKKLESLRNFGLSDSDQIDHIGTNGKMSEVCAALGLAQLPYVEERLSKARDIDQLYRQSISEIPGLKVLEIDPDLNHNFCYFPVVFESGFKLTRDEAFNLLVENKILAKKYFTPLLSEIPAYKNKIRTHGSLNNAEQLSKSTLCLPIYPDLELEEVNRIISILKTAGA